MNKRQTAEVKDSSQRKPVIPPQIVKSLEMNGLYGDRDITLKFAKGVKVVVGDNGSGKTTVLNVLNYLLSGSLHRLASIQFERLKLSFTNGTEIEIASSDLPNPYEWALRSPLLEEFRSTFGSESDFVDVAKTFRSSANDREFSAALYSTTFRALSNQNPYIVYRTFGKAWDAAASEKSIDNLSAPLRKKRDQIREQFPYPIIFLPTYRRVEEQIANLGLHLGGEDSRGIGREARDSHIFFGMRDVEQLFLSLQSEIRESVSQAYFNNSKKMIDQLIMEGFQHIDLKEYAGLQNEAAVSLVLKRLGHTLSQARRSELQNFLNGTTTRQSDTAVLAYFLKNIVDIYTTRLPLEDQIRSFVTAANRYLTGKELQFDEVTGLIQLFDRNDKPLALQSLSSGEKQLVSILARIYLVRGASFAVIVDEPELSLSIEWQKSLLPDLLRSGKCSFLLAATHSPFIFENELDQYTSIIATKFRTA